MWKPLIAIGAASLVIGRNPFRWAWCDAVRLWMTENPLKAALGVMTIIGILVVRWLWAD